MTTTSPFPLRLYTGLTRRAMPLLRRHLCNRVKRGKEDPSRLDERMGIAEKPRPEGVLLWIHAASVGEAQSALILIEALGAKNRHFLVTTGTVTSATLMAKRLPPEAIHQYAPLDAPQWVSGFLDHWRPDAALWMESELWPNMLREIKNRNIPAALINARLSSRSYRRWKILPQTAKTILSPFNIILCQTTQDETFFKNLGAKKTARTGNLKYSAAPLPCDDQALDDLKKAVNERPLWLYASTHDGEEDLACLLHSKLKRALPGILTVLVPRHPERRTDIEKICKSRGLRARLRGESRALPQPGDDIYIADTLGELGLFYRLSPVACIGRSFSHDGGGGHNPIEAAQLGCAVLHGPNVQNLEDIYNDMDKTGAALRLDDKISFYDTLNRFLTDGDALNALRDKVRFYATQQSQVLPAVMAGLSPMINETLGRCA